MRFSVALKCIGIVVLTTWIFYELGGSISPPSKLDFGLIGGGIATVVVLVYVLRNFVSENLVLAVGAAIPVTFISIVGYVVAQHSLLWLLIFLAGFPVYMWFASFFVSNFCETLYSLENIFHGEGFAPTEEEVIAGLKGLIYLLFCAAAATSVYKMFVYFSIGI